MPDAQIQFRSVRYWLIIPFAKTGIVFTFSAGCLVDLKSLPQVMYSPLSCAAILASDPSRDKHFCVEQLLMGGFQAGKSFSGPDAAVYNRFQTTRSVEL